MGYAKKGIEIVDDYLQRKLFKPVLYATKGQGPKMKAKMNGVFAEIERFTQKIITVGKDPE